MNRTIERLAGGEAADEVEAIAMMVFSAGSEYRRQRAALDDAMGEIDVYRGVNGTHASYAAQAAGNVQPNRRWWQIWRSTSTPAEHNSGIQGTRNSPYTSWSLNPDVAENYALRSQQRGRLAPGVVLHLRVPFSRLTLSPNTKDIGLVQGGGSVSEAEVLIRGRICVPPSGIRAVTP